MSSVVVKFEMADEVHEVKVIGTERGGKKFFYKGYGYVVDRRTPIKVRIRYNYLPLFKLILI